MDSINTDKVHNKTEKELLSYMGETARYVEGSDSRGHVVMPNRRVGGTSLLAKIAVDHFLRGDNRNVFLVSDTVDSAKLLFSAVIEELNGRSKITHKTTLSSVKGENKSIRVTSPQKLSQALSGTPGDNIVLCDYSYGYPSEVFSCIEDLPVRYLFLVYTSMVGNKVSKEALEFLNPETRGQESLYVIDYDIMPYFKGSKIDDPWFNPVKDLGMMDYMFSNGHENVSKLSSTLESLRNQLGAESTVYRSIEDLLRHGKTNIQTTNL